MMLRRAAKLWLWALRDRLHLSNQSQILAVEVELDVKVVIQFFLKKKNNSSYSAGFEFYLH